MCAHLASLRGKGSSAQHNGSKIKWNAESFARTVSRRSPRQHQVDRETAIPSGSSSKMQLERDSNCWLLLCASLTESSHFAADVVHGFGIRRIFGFDFFEVLVDDAAPAALIFDLLALNITEGIVLTLTDDFACEMAQGREFSFSSHLYSQFCSNAFCVRSSSKTIDSLEGSCFQGSS